MFFFLWPLVVPTASKSVDDGQGHFDQFLQNLQHSQRKYSDDNNVISSTGGGSGGIPASIATFAAHQINFKQPTICEDTLSAAGKELGCHIELD